MMTLFKTILFQASFYPHFTKITGDEASAAPQADVSRLVPQID